MSAGSAPAPTAGATGAEGPRSAGLRLRLFVALLATAAPVVTVLVWSNVRLRDEALAAAREDVVQVAELAAGQEAIRLRGARMLLEALDETPGMRDVDSCRRLAQALVEETDGLDVEAVGTATLDGRIDCRYPAPVRPLDVSERLYFRRTLARDDFAVGAYVPSLNDGTPVVGVAHPLHDDDGRPVKIAVVTLHLDGWLPAAYEAVAAAEGSQLAVVGADGRLLATYPDEPGARLPDDLTAVVEGDDDRQGTAELDGPDGEERIVGYASLGEGTGDGYIVYSVAASAVAGPAESTLTRSLSVVAVTVVIAVVLAWLLVSHLVLRPIARLAQAARRVASGDLTSRVGPEVPGELGVLGRAFDDMTSTLRSTLDRLQHDAMHDGLTTLPNRALLADRFAMVAAASSRDGSPYALVFIDLDGFKAVNDHHGHQAGDKLLATLAERLHGLVRPTDTVARLSGDEFVICVPGSPEGDIVELATTIAERARVAVRAPVVDGDEELTVTASIGVAVRHAPASFDEVLHEADLAMYDAKESGGDRVVRVDAERLRRAEARAGIEEALQRALAAGGDGAEDDGLTVVHQPVIDLRTGAAVGVEALARLRVGGRAVPPAEFITVAEQTGQIAALDEWVLRRAIAELAERWPGGSLSVNASAVELRPGFDRRIATVLEDTGWPAGQLTVEVTETALLDTAAARAVLQPLRDLGVGVAVDDFGTGFSSFTHLHDLPLTAVKIDRSFVAGIGTDPRSEAVVRAIVAMGSAMGLQVTAEGVEREAATEVLDAFGCHRGQGYLYGHPVPAADLAALAERPTVEGRRG